MKNALDLENINFVIGMAIEDRMVTQKRAEELSIMTDEEKIAWFDSLTTYEREAIIL